MLKKLINRMKYLNPDQVFDNKSCSIVMINDEAETTSETLGITAERRDYLMKLIEKAFNDENNKDHVDISIIVSKECKHPNELYFITGIICEINLQMQMKAQLKSSMDDLKNLLKGRRDSDLE